MKIDIMSLQRVEGVYDNRYGKCTIFNQRYFMRNKVNDRFISIYFTWEMLLLRI